MAGFRESNARLMYDSMSDRAVLEYWGAADLPDPPADMIRDLRYCAAMSDHLPGGSHTWLLWCRRADQVIHTYYPDFV